MLRTKEQVRPAEIPEAGPNPSGLEAPQGPSRPRAASLYEEGSPPSARRVDGLEGF